MKFVSFEREQGKMERVEYIVPCHFGLESVLKKEIMDLGYEIVSVEDGRITFAGDVQAMCLRGMCRQCAVQISFCVPRSGS